MKFLIGMPILLLIVGLSCINWRLSVKIALVLLVVEGALRKWVLPQASDLIYFLKDFVLLGAYIRYYVLSRTENKLFFPNKFLDILVLVASGWCLFQAFNPSLGSPMVGIFGLKSYLFYIPLMWMLPNLFQAEVELYHFLRLYMILTIPVGILGVLQFFSPADSPLNFYAPGEVKNIATFGVTKLVRVTGTFSYIGSYGAYLFVCFGLLISMLTARHSYWLNWIAIPALLLVTVNSIMNGSRSVVFALGLFLIGYFGIKAVTPNSRMLHSLKKFLLPVLIIVIAISIWFQPAIDSFMRRSTYNKDVNGRVALTFEQPLAFMEYKELDGYGTGATHQATQALRRVLDLPPGEGIPQVYEPEPGRIMLELGPIGFFFWYALRITILVNIWLVFWKLRRPWLKELALAVFLIQAIQLYNLLVFNYAFSVYYWFLSGFIFLLPQLELIEDYRKTSQDDQLSYLSSSPDW